MKRKIAMLCILYVLLFCLLITSCGQSAQIMTKDISDEESKYQGDNLIDFLVGTWCLIGVEDQDNTFVPIEDTLTDDYAGMTIWFELEADGGMVGEDLGTPVTGTWRITGENNIEINVDGFITMNLHLDGDRLLLNIDNNIAVFTKSFSSLLSSSEPDNSDEIPQEESRTPIVDNLLEHLAGTWRLVGYEYADGSFVAAEEAETDNNDGLTIWFELDEDGNFVGEDYGIPMTGTCRDVGFNKIEFIVDGYTPSKVRWDGERLLFINEGRRINSIFEKDAN